jgi:hypothetical protein
MLRINFSSPLAQTVDGAVVSFPHLLAMEPLDGRLRRMDIARDDLRSSVLAGIPSAICYSELLRTRMS